MDRYSEFVSKVGKTKPKVYLAGKICGHKPDWRHSLINNPIYCTEINPLDAELTEDCGPFECVGPFFVSGNHCSHGDHGAEEGVFGSRLKHHQHRRIFEVNKIRLKRADVVFAFVEEADCYGTLIELGMANTLDIPIFLRLPLEQHEDMWMAAEASTVVFPAGAPLGYCWKKLQVLMGMYPTSLHARTSPNRASEVSRPDDA
jgi:hypothetical protein